MERDDDRPEREAGESVGERAGQPFLPEPDAELGPCAMKTMCETPMMASWMTAKTSTARSMAVVLFRID
jgi:hypothetical protein